MIDTPKPKYQWTTQRILAATWFADLAGILVAMAYPVSIGIIRLFVVAGILTLWLLAIFLTRHIKWLTYTILALGLIAGVFALLPGRAIDPDSLQSEYLKQLKRYNGTPYVWGGENGRGIDCSGLVRRALINSHLLFALKSGNSKSLRAGLNLWWYDCSARALREQYRDFTSPVFSAQSINAIAASSLLPGDIAVTSDGVHVLAYLGNQQWIEADTGILKVIIVSVPSDNAWFTVPVQIMRWAHLKGASNIK
jgi:hypothetical protein